MEEHQSSLFVRAAIAFLSLPGIVALAAPAGWAWFVCDAQLLQPLGILPWTLGLAGLMLCVRDFYVAGKGTLAPWAPTTRLVERGFYRYTRNPMYASVLLMLIGWAVAFNSLGLWLYLLVATVAFHFRVTLGEEPWLARVHGEQWSRYAQRVPRWFW